MMNHRTHFIQTFALLLVCALLPGCWFSSDQEVVIYAALDREFSEPILNLYEEESGIDVLASYDIESTKSVGLTSQILLERDRPRCDLFWNNEILNTLRLEQAGVLDVYRSPLAGSYPQQFVSPDGHWHGFAARVRVLIVNTELVAEADRPDSIMDLIDPKWRGQVGIAKPLAGTTATHAACLFAAWGDDEAKAFFTKLKANAKVVSGNKQVAQDVAAGKLAFGLTDTDDAFIVKYVNRKGTDRDQVEIIFPDQREDQMGALFIPNTLAIIRGGPNPEHAQRLVNYLLQARVEELLATSDSAQFPLSSETKFTSPVAPEDPLKRMEIDFADALEKWDFAMEFLTEEFAAAE